MTNLKCRFINRQFNILSLRGISFTHASIFKKDFGCVNSVDATILVSKSLSADINASLAVIPNCLMAVV